MTTSSFYRRRVSTQSYALLGRALLICVVAFVILEIVALVLGVAVVGRHGGGPIQGWDNTVEQWWIHHRAHLVRVSKVIAVLGDAPVLGGIAVLLTIILLALRQRMRAFIPLVAYVGGEALVFITRQAISRPRPPTANYPAPNAIVGVHETSYSYPSGHATAAVAVIISLAVLAVITWRRWGWLVAGILALVAAAVACSRLVLGVHWFSDVAFGMALGIPWGIVVALALKDTPWPFARAGPSAARADSRTESIPKRETTIVADAGTPSPHHAGGADVVDAGAQASEAPPPHPVDGPPT